MRYAGRVPKASSDLLPAVPRGLATGFTYARARLRLGIASVGTLVVLSAGLLALGVPGDVLPNATSWALTDVAWLALLVALYAALSAPFDLLGGLVLPRRYGRPMAAKGFWRTWARGVAGHGLCLLAVALVLLAAGRAGGDGVVLAAALGLVGVMLSAQVWLAGLVGGVRREGDRLSAPDPSFVGGIVGLPGRDRTMLSAAWDEETARVQRVRREAVRQSGARTLGIVGAALFDLVGLAVVLFATSASVTSVAGVASVSLWVTLWSFLGLLVLPSLSRRAVIAADRSAVSGGIDRDELTPVLRRLDAAQEDEPRRRRLVETIFHPVPSLEGRIAALGAESGPALPQAWNMARAALFLSWASLGLLSRAVHCNCGRPALWVLFPGD